MGRVAFGISKLLRIFKSNDPSQSFELLFGSVAPGGDAGEQDAAPVGSMFVLQSGSSSKVFQKLFSTNASSDWLPLITTSNLNWRNNKVIFATDDTVAAGSAIDPTAWSDNEGAWGGDDAAVGQFVLADVDSALPKLFEISAITSNTSIDLVAVNAAQAIKDNDTFVIQYYLPDTPSDQERQAIIHFPSATGPGVKIGDFNWALANGINLNGLAPTVGAVAGTDSVQVAVEKMEKGLIDNLAALGIARNALNFGAFINGALVTLPQNATGKAIFQKIGDLLFDIRTVESTGIATPTVVDSVPHATVKCVTWIIEVWEDATPANRRTLTINALSDGTTVDYDDSHVKKLGANFNADIDVVINGANMELVVDTTELGVSCRARRLSVLAPV